jgi:hypothetical protein
MIFASVDEDTVDEDTDADGTADPVCVAARVAAACVDVVFFVAA